MVHEKVDVLAAFQSHIRNGQSYSFWVDFPMIFNLEVSTCLYVSMWQFFTHLHTHTHICLFRLKGIYFTKSGLDARCPCGTHISTLETMSSQGSQSVLPHPDLVLFHGYIVFCFVAESPFTWPFPSWVFTTRTQKEFYKGLFLQWRFMCDLGRPFIHSPWKFSLGGNSWILAVKEPACFVSTNLGQQCYVLSPG
jgi:hypothetical protein